MLALRKDEIDIVGGGILLQLGYGGSAFFAGVIEALRYKDLESYQAIKRFNKNQAKLKVLDIGCGNGFTTEAILKMIRHKVISSHYILEMNQMRTIASPESKLCGEK